MRDFRTLSVWTKAHALAVETYKVTSGFPKDELYGLVSQLRRAAVSVPANIAEGCGRSGEAEFRHFLHISTGSATELEYHLLLARDLLFLSSVDYEGLAARVTEVKRMLAGLVQTLKATADS
jgi:four helix bundle protein